MIASFLTNHPVCFLLLGTVFALGACQSTSTEAPTHAQISHEVTTSAEVVALDRSARVVTLRREDGKVVSLVAGSEVRNFDQIKVGDQLVARYLQKLAATKRFDKENAELAEAEFRAARARPGTQPRAGVGLTISRVVKIESIDLENDFVVFSLASGEFIAHKVKTPDGRAFVRGLERGDVVQLDYTEAAALSIEKRTQ